MAGVNVGSNWVLDPDTVVRLQKAGENLGKKVLGGKPRRTTEGTKGTNGLCDVVGNVAEWSADGEPFGISFVREPESAVGRTLTRHQQGDPIGLRLVYEPTP